MGYKIKKIYVGTQQVRPPVKQRTFTISWTEKSNMSSGWTYSDDAAGLTAGSSDFDDFFGYSAVLLGTDGQEKAEVTQSASGGAGKLDFSSLGTLTGTTNNVMVKFPLRGIKISKSGSTVTLSITDNPNADGYQYYAFTKNGTIKPQLYLGAFKSSLTNGTAVSSSGTIAKSWATNSRTENVSPLTNKTISATNTCHTANGTGYSQIAIMQRMYINALYMMKYGNPNSQSVVGLGYTGGSATVAPGTTVSSSTNATYGTTSNTGRVKLFGLEDWWGNVNEWVDGIYTDASRNVCVAVDNSSFANTAIPSSLPSNYRQIASSFSSNSFGEISSVGGENASMFIPKGLVSNSNYNTYYCDIGDVAASGFAYAGGRWDGGASDGAFFLSVSNSASSAATGRGSRLMYL